MMRVLKGNRESEPNKFSNYYPVRTVIDPLRAKFRNLQYRSQTESGGNRLCYHGRICAAVSAKAQGTDKPPVQSDVYRRGADQSQQRRSAVSQRVQKAAEHIQAHHHRQACIDNSQIVLCQMNGSSGEFIHVSTGRSSVWLIASSATVTAAEIR